MLVWHYESWKLVDFWDWRPEILYLEAFPLIKLRFLILMFLNFCIVWCYPLLFLLRSIEIAFIL
jgi:hypothetical protein